MTLPEGSGNLIDLGPQSISEPVYRDGVHTRVTCFLGWTDRLRVLCGRPLHLRVRVDTENEVGRTREAVTEAWVDPIFRPRRYLAEVAKSEPAP